MIKMLLKLLGDPNEKKVKSMMGIVEHINALEPEFAKLTDEQLRAKTDEFREILSKRPTSKNYKEDLKSAFLYSTYADMRSPYLFLVCCYQ